MKSVFDHSFKTHNPLWDHLTKCWANGFDYQQSVSYSFSFSKRLFDVAMQACDDDYDAYLYESDRDLWRKE